MQLSGTRKQTVPLGLPASTINGYTVRLAPEMAAKLRRWQVHILSQTCNEVNITHRI